MKLVDVIGADPELAWRAREVDAETRDVIRKILVGLDAAYSALAGELLTKVEADNWYAHYLAWTANRAAVALPEASPLAIALVRDEMDEPHDGEGQAEYRAVVMREWLRHRLGVEVVQ